MGIASLSVRLDLAPTNPLRLCPRVLTIMQDTFIQPKSFEIWLPGLGKWTKLPNSIDREVAWVNSLALPVLADEQVVERMRQFTVLRVPDRYLTVPRDLSLLIETIAEFLN